LHFYRLHAGFISPAPLSITPRLYEAGFLSPIKMPFYRGDEMSGAPVEMLSFRAFKWMAFRQLY